MMLPNAIKVRIGSGLEVWKAIVLFSAVLSLLNAFVNLRQLTTPGFPLDDAWIHQTYARNLAYTGQMAFNLGEPSAGDTSPGWVLLLSLGYRLGMPPTVWAYFLGSMFAIGTALMVWQLSSSYFVNPVNWQLVSVFSILEWHLAWASLSGMEITAFTFLTLLFLWLIQKQVKLVWLGALGALVALVRPEGLVLAAGYALKLAISLRKEPRRLLYAAIQFGFPFVAFVGPLIIFNLQYAGSIFPNTAIAKNMQYAFPWTPGLAVSYLVNVGLYFVQGPFLLLFPFLWIPIYQAWKDRSGRLLVPVFWIAGLIGLYAVVLPAIYHNGRYLMPLIPFVIVFGLEGLHRAAARFHKLRSFWNVYQLAIIAMVVVLWVNKADSYALGVNLLEQNNARIARWIQSNTSPTDVIATHDIGVIGYFGGRRIVDLAGLVTPQVIPLLHDPRSLAEFCRRNKVTYISVFSGYYPALIRELNADLVFSPDAKQMQKLGLDPFEVYAVK